MLFFDNGQCGVGRIVFIRLALGQPTGDNGLRGVAVQDQERRPSGFGNLSGGVTLCAFQECGIQHHRVTGAQHGVGNLVQACVGGSAGVLIVDTGLQGVLYLLFAKQALALYIRTQAYRAQGFDQAHGHVALAHG